MKTMVQDSLHGLVGQSPQIERIRYLIGKLARSRFPVLLLGESGTGKEVVARAIYNLNPAGDFVPIDCGALSNTLMESELFGHVKGSFTGADSNKKGLIELADNGTVFFDEIGELRLDMQVKLLRLLQERELRPVGSLKARKVDIRVIAATNRDLKKEAARGAFRQDLFYRLNVVTLRLPPLRERREDIPLLIDYFLERLGVRHSLSAEARAAMLAYDWPGNVRELENAVHRMVAINSGPVLHLVDLPSALQGSAAASDLNHLSSRIAEPDDSEIPCVVRPPRAPIKPLPETEKRAILEALEYTRGDRAEAARLLGIGRTTLYRRLKEYQIKL